MHGVSDSMCAQVHNGWREGAVCGGGVVGGNSMNNKWCSGPLTDDPPDHRRHTLRTRERGLYSM